MSTDDRSPNNLSTLEEWTVVNVENLQRSLARTRLALVLVAVVLGAWILAPQAMRAARAQGILAADASPEELRARRFVLTDASGRARGTWSVDGAGVTRLLLRDAAGVPRVRLSVLESGSPGLALADDGGHNRLVLGLLADRSSSLVIADPAGATRVVLGLAPDDGATLVFADPSGRTRAGLGVDTQGRPTFLMAEDEDPAIPDSGAVR
jgi:hypothetical protein